MTIHPATKNLLLEAVKAACRLLDDPTTTALPLAGAHGLTNAYEQWRAAGRPNLTDEDDVPARAMSREASFSSPPFRVDATFDIEGRVLAVCPTCKKEHPLRPERTNTGQMTVAAERAHAMYREVMHGVTYSGNPIPQWSEESASMRVAWVRSAEAVAQQHPSLCETPPDVVCRSCGKPLNIPPPLRRPGQTGTCGACIEARAATTMAHCDDGLDDGRNTCSNSPAWRCQCDKCQRHAPDGQFHACSEHVGEAKAKHEKVYPMYSPQFEAIR